MAASHIPSDVPVLPADLQPSDGRFGCGPSKVRPAHTNALAASPLMGTSHRQAPVLNLVASIREGLRALYHLPSDWEIAIGNGGSTAFWAVATTSLVRTRATHAVFGEFGQKFADETLAAPFLSPSLVISAEAGTVATLVDERALSAFAQDEGPDVDLCAYPHHETSTGALSPLYRVTPRSAGVAADALTVVDATSIAGGVTADVTATDVYYFAPQKCFASDGGLWFAFLSPAAQERARTLRGQADRWMPQFLDLSVALDNSVKNQTLNTPAIATLIMMDEQIQWMLANGGLSAMEERCRASSGVIYEWAKAHPFASPFIPREEWRSPVVATIDFDEAIDAAYLARVLRANGVVDVEPYRKLGRNQLRIATFPSVDTADVEKLVASIDWVIAQRV